MTKVRRLLSTWALLAVGAGFCLSCGEKVRDEDEGTNTGNAFVNSELIYATNASPLQSPGSDEVPAVVGLPDAVVVEDIESPLVYVEAAGSGGTPIIGFAPLLPNGSFVVEVPDAQGTTFQVYVEGAENPESVVDVMLVSNSIAAVTFSTTAEITSRPGTDQTIVDIDLTTIATPEPPYLVYSPDDPFVEYSDIRKLLTVILPIGSTYCIAGIREPDVGQSVCRVAP